MKEHVIEVSIDEKGNIVAETKGMAGKICAQELDAVLDGIPGERVVENTADFYKEVKPKQTITRG
ncbi:MAG: hypothetical protein OD918_02940 [Gammaproteobacteria bacterium]